jgi:hypothetical protein
MFSVARNCWIRDTGSVEGFWENILEILAIAAKIFVVALVVRTALHFMDIKVYFPVVDPIIDMAMALLSGRAN